MGIAKKARGLQRFMLDCGFWQSPSWKGLRKVAVIGLQAAAVSYCNEHLTDGQLPGPAEELASALGLQERDIKAPLDLLIDKKRWVKGVDEYRIVGYLDHNPSRSEVSDDRLRRAQAAAKANHERWHVEKGIIDPTCDLCTSDKRSESDQTPDVDDIPCEGTEGTEGSKASKPKDVSPSSSTSEERDAAGANGDEDDEIALTKEAWRRYWAMPPHIRDEVSNPTAYVRGIVENDLRPNGIPKPPPSLALVRAACEKCDNGNVLDEHGDFVGRCDCVRAAS